MDVPDIYLDAALAEITLSCESCDARLGAEDLPADQPRFGDDNWYQNLAAESLRRGWLIEYSGTEANYFDYRIKCPKCANRPSL